MAGRLIKQSVLIQEPFASKWVQPKEWAIKRQNFEMEALLNKIC